MTRPYKGGRGDRNQEGGELGLQQRAAHIMKGNCIWWAQLPRPNAACNRETAYGGPYVQFPTLLVTTSFRQRAFQNCMPLPNAACNRETAYGGPYVQFPTLPVTTSFRQHAFQDIVCHFPTLLVTGKQHTVAPTSSSPRCSLQPASDSVLFRNCMPLPNAACYSQTAYGGPLRPVPHAARYNQLQTACVPGNVCHFPTLLVTAKRHTVAPTSSSPRYT